MGCSVVSRSVIIEKGLTLTYVMSFYFCTINNIYIIYRDLRGISKLPGYCFKGAIGLSVTLRPALHLAKFNEH
jgi:hypothetical protein